METKFTPGKWEVNWYPDADGEVNYYGIGERYDDSKAQANAHLIAASPEMYAYLDKIAKSETVWCISDIEELLALARGEESNQ